MGPARRCCRAQLQAWQVVADAFDQAVEAGRVVGVDALALQQLGVAQGFAAGVLGLNHRFGGIGGVLTGRLALGQPLADHAVRGLAVENQEGHAAGFGNLGRAVALLALEVGGIDDHREAGMQGGAGQLVQVLVDAGAGLRAVNAGMQLGLLVGALFTEQALAFDIRAQAHSAQGFDQAQGYVALADRRNAVGDGQEAGGNGAVAFRQVGVAAVLREDFLALRGVLLLTQTEQADLGAHQGAVGLVEIQQVEGGVVAGVFQPGIDKASGQRLEVAILQVHGQEGGVRGDVDQAERLVELDAVEQHHVTVEQGGVA